MKIYVPGAIEPIQGADKWFNASPLQPMLRDLEQTLRKAEKHWGECFVFLEADAPMSDHARQRQLDLLIAFSDRAASCELKGHLQFDAFWKDYQHHKYQVEKQSERLRDILRSARQDSASLWPFLVATNLKLSELQEAALRKRHLGHHHFTLAGSDPLVSSVALERTDPKPPKRDGVATSAYFGDALMDALGALHPQHAGTGAVAICLRKSIERMRREVGHRMLEFSDFSAAHTFLATKLSDQVLIPKAEYVRGLRNNELHRARVSLDRHHFAEIVGPPNVGKTEFTIEVLQDYGPIQGGQVLPLEPIVIREARGVRDILEELAQMADVHDHSSLLNRAGTKLFSTLSSMRVVFWIRDYDLTSVGAIKELRTLLESSRTHGEAYWILESVDTVDVEGARRETPQRVLIRPLGGREIGKIIDRREKHDTSLDRNVVIDAAQGIPGRAVLYWEQGDSSRIAERLDHHEFFYHGLSRDERDVAVAIAYILTEAPLGCTAELAIKWCEAVLQLSGRDDVAAVVRGVLRKAEGHTFLALECAGRRQLGEERDDQLLSEAERLRSMLVPNSLEDARVARVQVVDPHFLTAMTSKLDTVTVRSWEKRLKTFFQSAVQMEGSFTAVSLGLLTGDVVPFVRSGFRSSSYYLPQLQRWLARKASQTSAAGRTPDQAYFEHWLSWIADHYWDVHRPGSTTWKIRPPGESNVQHLLFDTVRARGQHYRDGKKHDWDAWANTAKEFWSRGEFDLWADCELRRAQATLIDAAGGPAKCWEIMRAVLSEESRISSSNALGDLQFHILSFFNKPSMWRNELPKLKEEAKSLVPRLALSMIENGYLLDNLNSVANGMFFFSRSIELVARPKSATEVESYATIMRFVRRISPSRRIQAMLTEGSAHRHFWEAQELSWEEFRVHADEALGAYRSAYEGASRALMPTNTANALVYCGAVIMRSLAYRNEEGLRGWLIDVLGKELPRLEGALFDGLVAQVLKSKGEISESFRSSMYLHYAMQIWLVATLVEQERADKLRGALSSALATLRFALREERPWQRPKLVRGVLEDINQVIAFTSGEPSGRSIIALVADQLSGLMTFATVLVNATTKGRAPLLGQVTALEEHLRRYSSTSLQSGSSRSVSE